MTRYRFLTYDVFTDSRFGGNPLAILPEADGLDTAAMQRIAREFNYSETTFVTPAGDDGMPVVRIFTPGSELPFAGHPTIGTAIALRDLGRVDGDRIVLAVKAGPVPVTFASDGLAEFRAPGQVEIGEELPVEAAMAILGLERHDIAGKLRMASAGLAFPFVELRDLEALGRASMHPVPRDNPLAGEVFIFTRMGGRDLRGRLFAPGMGISEDPATGSAAAALAGMLASESGEEEAELGWTLVQGVEMGRPSRIGLRASRKGGKVEAIHVAGRAVAVMQGHIELG